MHQGQRRGHRRMAQVGVVFFDLLGHQHAFIHHGPARQAAHIEMIAPSLAPVPNGIFRPTPNDIELALERQFVRHFQAPADENLTHERLPLERGLT